MAGLLCVTTNKTDMYIKPTSVTLWGEEGFKIQRTVFPVLAYIVISHGDIGIQVDSTGPAIRSDCIVGITPHLSLHSLHHLGISHWYGCLAEVFPARGGITCYCGMRDKKNHHFFITTTLAETATVLQSDKQHKL